MKYLLAISLVALLAAPAHAQNFEAGRSAARTGDYAVALREWRPLAENGEAADLPA